MPGKSTIFTPPSILFRPQQKPLCPQQRLLVEAPGTAPGSERLISSPIYRHSRSSRQNEYRGARAEMKGRNGALSPCQIATPRVDLGAVSTEASRAVRTCQPSVQVAKRATALIDRIRGADEGNSDGRLSCGCEEI